MKIVTSLIASASLMLASLVWFQGCSSAEKTGEDEEGVAADDDDEETSTEADGAGSEEPGPAAGPNNDSNCNSTNAETGAACTVDCQLGCGFQEMGTKTCSCVNGVYEECPCPRPAAFQGAAHAPFCRDAGSADGLAATLKGTACTMEWDICIGEEAVASTPQGCACLTNEISGGLTWFCGSTNKWFALDTGDVAECPTAPDGQTICAPLNPDPSCTSSDAKTGAACERDCQIGCGFQEMGTKLCTCSGGAYAQCPCPRPADFGAAATAPLCTEFGSPDGLTDPLKGTACETEWDACIGSDAVTGTTPRGCVCMTHNVTGDLQWFCGSTNKWFMY